MARTKNANVDEARVDVVNIDAIEFRKKRTRNRKKMQQGLKIDLNPGDKPVLFSRPRTRFWSRAPELAKTCRETLPIKKRTISPDTRKPKGGSAKRGRSRKEKKVKAKGQFMEDMYGSKSSEKRKPKPSVEMVCSMRNFAEFINKFKKRIDAEMWDKLYYTCFGMMISRFYDGLIKEKDCVKQQRNFEEIMVYYDGEGVFYFDGLLVELTMNNVIDLFGLPNIWKRIKWMNVEAYRNGPAGEGFPLVDHNKGPNRAEIKKRLRLELSKPTEPKATQKGKEKVSKMKKPKGNTKFLGRPNFCRWKIAEMYDLTEIDKNPRLLVDIMRRGNNAKKAGGQSGVGRSSLVGADCLAV